MNSFQHPNFTDSQTQLFNCIKNLAQNINPQESQAFLRKKYNHAPETFLQNIFRLISKFKVLNDINNNPIQFQQSLQLLLLYLKHLIYIQKYRMPNFIQQLVILYEQFRLSKFRNLALDCFCAYLKKVTQNLYTKDYLHELALKLLQFLQNQKLTNEFLVFLTEILQNITSDRNSRPCISNQSQRLISVIVSRYSTKRPQHIYQQIWTKTIAVLSNYSKTKPSVQFLSAQICIPGLSTDIYYQLVKIFNNMHERMSNLQICYNIMQAQLTRIQNFKFINLLDQQFGIQSIQATCTSILNLLKLSLPKFKLDSIYNTDINQIILLQYFRQYKLFSRVVGGIIKLIKIFEGQNNQLCFILVYIIQQFTEELGEQITEVYLKEMASQIDQDYIFCFLSGVPRSTMEVLKATKLLIQNVKNLLNTNIQFLENSLPRVCMFLNFVLHYLSSYHYLEDPLVFQTLSSLVNYYLPMPSTPHILKCYSFSIGCFLQKFQNQFTYNLVKPGDQKNKLEKILSISYELLKISINNQKSQDCIQIINKGLEQFKETAMMRQCLLEYFSQSICECGLQKNSQQQFIAQIFLKLLENHYNCTNTYKSFENQSNILASLNNSPIYQILTICLNSYNKSLQDQVCDFILKILWTINSLLGRNEISSGQHEQVLNNVYNTKVYRYIQNCLQNDDEDIIYCKILMQTILNEKGRKLVEQILGRICSKTDAEKFVHNFDKVWEALVIIYGVRNKYTEQKRINTKFDKILSGSLEMLLMNLTIDEQKEYDGRVSSLNKKQKNSNIQPKKKIYWSYLPDVRNYLEPGSFVGAKVQIILNQEL